MTKNDGLNLIFKYLEKHDSFTIPNDYKKLEWELITDGSSEEEQEAALHCALENLVEQKVLSKFEKESNKRKITTWVIQESQKNAPIQIEIGRQTAENLVKVTNQFLPMMDIHIKERSTVESISEAEIIIVLQVISFMAKQLQDATKEEEAQDPTKE